MLVVAWVPEDWAGSSGQMRVQASEAESDQYHIVVHSPNSMYEEESGLLLKCHTITESKCSNKLLTQLKMSNLSIFDLFRYSDID